MKAIWMTVAIALSFSSVACGGLGACKSGCNKADDCDIDGFDVDDCKDGCEEAQEDADDAGCKSEWNKLMKCSKKEFDCDGSGDACESEGEDYAKCVTE